MTQKIIYCDVCQNSVPEEEIVHINIPKNNGNAYFTVFRYSEDGTGRDYHAKKFDICNKCLEGGMSVSAVPEPEQLTINDAQGGEY